MKNVAGSYFRHFVTGGILGFCVFFSLGLAQAQEAASGPMDAVAQETPSSDNSDDGSNPLAPDKDTVSCTLELSIDGPVAPGTYDYIERGLKKAGELQCRSILLRINTPGGGLPTTRKIVELILASPIPFLCLVSPSGGHAGSAGAIVLYACHVSGAEPATNIGAATPVSAGGEVIPEDMRNKLVQDTVSWVVGLAKLRGRNVELAEKIITEAKALDSEEAAKAGVIDKMALDQKSFLDFAEGREVVMAAGQTARVQTAALVPYKTDARYEFLQILTDPQWAYLIFMISLALLYFELTNPGALVPGIVGAFGLIASLISFHRLEVWWGGVSMIVLGLVLLIAEAFLPSFGALGIGGILILGAGSLLLYDPAVTGAALPLSLVIATTGTLGALMLGLAYVGMKTRKKGKAIAEVALLGRIGEVSSVESPSLRRGMMSVRGEIWKFVSEKDVRPGDLVEVIEQEKLTLKVRPAQNPGPRQT